MFGQVKPELLSEIFRGELDGKKLVQNAGMKNRTPGWDCTFSAPKSVSVAWSQADKELGNEIRAAHAEAVNKALEYLEEKAGFTRRGKGGQELEKCSLVFATYEHGTSRAQDPQLPSHASYAASEHAQFHREVSVLFYLPTTACLLYTSPSPRDS